MWAPNKGTFKYALADSSLELISLEFIIRWCCQNFILRRTFLKSTMAVVREYTKLICQTSTR